MPTKKATKRQPKYVAKKGTGRKKAVPTATSMYSPEFLQDVKLLTNVNEVLRNEKCYFRVSAYAGIEAELKRAKDQLKNLRHNARVQREVIHMLESKLEKQTEGQHNES